MEINKVRYEMQFKERFKPHTKLWLENFIKLQYKYYLGKELNLEDPQTFNEKLAWLKLHWDDDRMAICADKARATAYAEAQVPALTGHTVRQIACWEKPEDFDFDALPQAFALKLNCGSGTNLLVRDKSKLDLPATRELLTLWLKPEHNHYFASFERSYKDIPSKIVVEELVDFDFKIEFFCFSGVPRFYWVIFNDKTPDVCASFFDMEGNLMDLSHKYPNVPFEVKRPPAFEEMAACAASLSQGFPFVRVDFYSAPHTWYFCEMTFFHWAGLKAFTPEEYDAKFGALITLPPRRP